MEKIKVTASGNFENKKSWAGIKKHLEHDAKIEHKNKFLNTEESKKLRQYNRHKILIDYESFVNTEFGSYVKEHDKNLKDKKHAYGSVDRFLKVDSTGKQRKLQPAQAYVEKFADEENYHKILKELQKELLHCYYPGQNTTLTAEQAQHEALKAVANGLENYADGFNNRNPNLKMFEYYTHLDEKGAPHLHARVMPFYQAQSKTKAGRVKKPSWSLNRALRAQYGGLSGNNKQRLSKFRQQEDQALISSMNNAFENYLGKDTLKLYRKTEVEQYVTTGISHEEYTAEKNNELKQKIIDKQAKIKEQDNEIAQNDITLFGQNRTIIDNTDAIKRQQKDIDDNESLKRQQQKDIDHNESLKKQQQTDIDANNLTKKQQEQEITENTQKIKQYREMIKRFKASLKKLSDKFSAEIISTTKKLMMYFNGKRVDINVSIDEVPQKLHDIADVSENLVDYYKSGQATKSEVTQSKPQVNKQPVPKQKQQEDDLEL